VLVALAICLGASTTFTNRGSSLHNLIKAGQSYVFFTLMVKYSNRFTRQSLSQHNRCAKVQVVLRNRGAEAYRPDYYGTSIAIERTIAPQGKPCSYRISTF